MAKGKVEVGSLGELLDRLRGRMQSEVVQAVASDDVGAKAQLFADAAEVMGEIVNHDKVSSLFPTVYAWVSVGSTTFAYTEAPEDKDPHVHVLSRDPDNEFVWHFWVLCPIRQMAVPIQIFGDAKRAMHRADVLIDVSNDVISREALWVASGRQPYKGGATTGRATSDAPTHEEVAKALADPPPGKSPVRPDPDAKSRVTPFASGSGASPSEPPKQ